MADRARRERPRGITSHVGYEPLYVKNTKTNGFLDSDSDDDYFRKQTKAQKVFFFFFFLLENRENFVFFLVEQFQTP